jgi:YD repeat-containing protein
MPPADPLGLLIRLRAALCTGELAAVAALLPELERAASALPADAAALAAIGREARRNVPLFAAAARGLRAARARLAEIAAARGTMQTYDGQGRRQTVTLPACGLARRL